MRGTTGRPATGPHDTAPPRRTGTTGRRGGDDLVVVTSVRLFPGFTDVYEARWKDGRHKRRVLAVVENWDEADAIVAEAVRAAYDGAFRPRVEVPLRAWH